jgi:hypothetical protein
VLGQGEEGPAEEGEDHYAKDEDVEGNLLRPVGVESEPIDLLLKCFLGLDMPRADVSLKTGIALIDKITRQADKEYCDPYVKVSLPCANAPPPPLLSWLSTFPFRLTPFTPLPLHVCTQSHTHTHNTSSCTIAKH